jgi:geranylgeranylglycerol-phosphate geranylgeranyltransferase
MCVQVIRIRDKRGISSRKKSKDQFFLSQLILFQSRKRWGIIYALATVVGLFCVPNSGLNPAGLEMKNLLGSAANGILLPVASFMIITGMYVLNDLVDADLDRSNGKKRPIPTGQVSKRDAQIFIILTNVTGILLVLITFNLSSMLIALIIASIGLMYSAPKVALKDRFFLKTLSIAIALMLCAVLGSTASWHTNYLHGNTNIDKLIMPVHAAVMLGIMVFITSPFNDVADVTGDKVAGRRTIPVVIGRENTIKMAIYLSISMTIVSWLFYGLHAISTITPVLVSFIAMITIINMIRTLKHIDDSKYVRKQHKKSMPLHIMLQSALILGALLLWI